MMTRKTIFVVIAMVVAGAAVVAYAYFRETPAPPIRNADTAMSFIASDEYMRLSDKQRLEYALNLVEHLGRLPYDEFMRVISPLNRDRMKMMHNIRNTPGHEKVGSALFATFLDQFWAQNEGKRAASLIAIALIQQGEFGKHPEKYGLPTANQIKSEMNKFVSRQPVKTQAQCAQFMLELKRQRETMGLKDPF